MRELGPPDTHYLSAALGWVELGNAAEAKAELDHVSADQRGRPEVMEIWWMVHAQEQDWPAALAVADGLLAADPGRPSGWLHRAYSLRRVEGGGLGAAWEALRPAFDKFPAECVIPYNLACYACQLGRLDEAREWFRRAVKAGNKERMIRMALADPDLEPLWAELRKG